MAFCYAGIHRRHRVLFTSAAITLTGLIVFVFVHSGSREELKVGMEEEMRKWEGNWQMEKGERKGT